MLDAATRPAASIVFDLEETFRSSDRQRLIEYTRAGQSRGRVKYSHMSRNEELRLANPDIVAWCAGPREARGASECDRWSLMSGRCE